MKAVHSSHLVFSHFPCKRKELQPKRKWAEVPVNYEVNNASWGSKGCIKMKSSLTNLCSSFLGVAHLLHRISFPHNHTSLSVINKLSFRLILRSNCLYRQQSSFSLKKDPPPPPGNKIFYVITYPEDSWHQRNKLQSRCGMNCSKQKCEICEILLSKLLTWH